jgi:CDP-glucose 4,6-dehydratase
VHWLLTGHTGFKGAWLALQLAQSGHEVSGLALDPEPGSLYEAADVAPLLRTDSRGDVRDPAIVHGALAATRPDVVVHLAAQPLVRESYRDPRWTMETNVMGTFNVLEAVGRAESVRALLVVTTDKVYRNVRQVAGYVEPDALGGHDPYSASKAMADLLAQSWTASFDGPPTAIVRAGNVIGGGDVSTDRLVPDLIRSFVADEPAQIRFPDAVRPWQHVLDCLAGYRLIVDALLAGGGHGQWNIGPGPESFVTVGALADLAAQCWGSGAAWTGQAGDHPHEAELLALDATKARSELGWHDHLSFEQSVAWTVDWYRRVQSGQSARSVSTDQLAQFAALAS